MHWLLILALLSSTTNIKDQNATGSSLNKMVENALRQELGGNVDHLKVDVKRSEKGGAGDFDSFAVNLDGFSADRLADRFRDSQREDSSNKSSRNFATSSFDASSLDIGNILKGGFGDILGGIFGSKFSTQGRIGHLNINAGNFTYDKVRYDGLRVGVGEIKFDWSKALRGNFDIDSMAPGNINLQLASDQAQRLVAPRLPMVKDLKLSFDNGRANLGGRADFYGVGIPFETGGRLSVETNQVRVDDLRLKVAKLALPSFLMGEITKAVNPLYDFDPNHKWPIAVNMYSAAGATNANTLQMRGGLKWLGFNRDKKTKEK
jgi:hypothetical protein